MKGLRQRMAHPARQLGSVARRYAQAPTPGQRELTQLGTASRTRLPAPTPLAPPATSSAQGMQRLEAILFLAREPLNSRKLSQLANLADGTEARTLIRQLNEKYDQSGRAFRVEEVAGGFYLLSRPKFASWIRRLEYVPGETRLSAPAMETLAVVAYRQPVLRVDIEAIRGVSCGEILRQLMERDLVRISGRSEELGRPFLYSTTRRFLETFGLQNLDQLPRVEALRPDPPSEPDTLEPDTSEIEADTEDDVMDSPTPSQSTDSNERPKEESDVSVTTAIDVTTSDQDEQQLAAAPAASATATATAEPKAADDDEEWEYGDYYDDDEDEDEYDEDEEDDEYEESDEEDDDEEDDDEDDDDEDDDDDDEDDDLEDEDETYEDPDWEEVDDDDEEEDDDDWDEDVDDDWGDDEEEEEEEDEDW